MTTGPPPQRTIGAAGSSRDEAPGSYPPVPEGLGPKRQRRSTASASSQVAEAPGDWRKVKIGTYGWIHYEERQQKLNAHCAKHRCEKCRADRLSCGSEHPNRRGQGRPIGFLVAWLLEGDELHSKADHGRDCKEQLSGIGGWEARVYARDWAKTLPGMDAVFAVERAKYDDEESEPETIPIN